MGRSIYPGALTNTRRVETGTVSAGQKVTLRLNKDHLIKEHAIAFAFSATYGTAPTAVDTSVLGKLISSIALNVSGPQGGNLVRCSGLNFFPFSAIYEDQDTGVISLGTTTTVKMILDLHHSMDEAVRDLITALRGDRATSVDLEITLNPLATWDEVFTAAAAPTAVSASVSVYSIENDPAAFAAFPEVGTGRHFQVEHVESASGAGNTSIYLDTGNLTRGLGISVENASNAMSDSAVSEVSLVIAGEEVMTCSWADFRRLTARYFGLDATGFAFKQFSDDDRGYLDLRQVSQARLQLTTTAACEIRVLQDYATNG